MLYVSLLTAQKSSPVAQFFSLLTSFFFKCAVLNFIAKPFKTLVAEFNSKREGSKGGIMPGIGTVLCFWSFIIEIVFSPLPLSVLNAADSVSASFGSHLLIVLPLPFPRQRRQVTSVGRN